MTTTPLPPRPGEPIDPELRDRYRTDASHERQARRAESVRLAGETPPSRTPVGPIRVIAALVAVALVLLAALTLVGPMLKQSETTEQPLVASSAIDLRGQVGDIRVRAAEPGESPRVVTTKTWGLRKPSASVAEQGDTTRMRSSCPEPSLGMVCQVDWLIVVPAATDLDINHGVGQVVAEGMTGDLVLQMGVGDVTVRESEAETVRIDMGVGALTYEAVEPPRVVSVRQGVGETTLRLPDVPYRVNSTQGPGQVVNNIGNDPSAERRISLETGVGQVTIDPN